MVQYQSQKVEVEGWSTGCGRGSKDGRIQVKVRGGGEAVVELVVPPITWPPWGWAVGEVARALGGRVDDDGRQAEA
jgi:hypothetical protein